MSVLYQIISTTFCVIVVLSNIISAKLIPLPYFDFIIPAGLITYPLTFLLSDLVTEIYGAKAAKQMVYIAFGMSLLSVAMTGMALFLPADQETHQAFQIVMGLNSLRVFSSLMAYFISQIVDIQLYTWIKAWTGPHLLWVRNNGSTCLSQLIDTLVIDIIFLYWGLSMPFNQVLLIIVFSYAYKVFFSLASTPLFYLCVFLIRKKEKEIERVNFSENFTLKIS